MVAKRGADDVGGKGIGLSIVLPQEQHPNHFVTPELSFQFHYFAVRKMRFLLRAKALLADRMADPLTPSLVVPAAAAVGAFALIRHGRRRRQTYRALAEHREVLIAGRESRLAGLRDPEALRAGFERGRILRVEALLAPESLAALWQECEATRTSAERAATSSVTRRAGPSSFGAIHGAAPACLAFYHALALRDWLSAVVGEALEATADLDQSSCSLLYYEQAGDHIRWR